MTKLFCLDLRVRAVALGVAGETVRPVAATLRAGVSRVVKWPQLSRDGRAAPGNMGGHRPRVLIGEHPAWLRTVFNFVHREQISYKKSVFPAAQNRPGVARHRALETLSAQD